MILRGESQQEGFCFDTDGVQKGTASKEFYDSRIEAMRLFAKKFPWLPELWLCGSCHEGKIAKLYPTQEILEATLQNTAAHKILADACFCHDKEGNDLCAHRTLGKANPLGRLLPIMDQFGLVDHDSWNQWHLKISTLIQNNDTTVGDQRYERPGEAIAAGKKEQVPIAKQVTIMRRRLGNLLMKAITLIESDTQIAELPKGNSDSENFIPDTSLSA